MGRGSSQTKDLCEGPVCMTGSGVTDCRMEMSMLSLRRKMNLPYLLHLQYLPVCLCLSSNVCVSLALSISVSPSVSLWINRYLHLSGCPPPVSCISFCFCLAVSLYLCRLLLLCLHSLFIRYTFKVNEFPGGR